MFMLGSNFKFLLCWSSGVNECWNYRRQSTVPALLGFQVFIFFWFLYNAFWLSRFSHHFEMSSISDVYKYKFNIFNFFLKQDLAL